MPDSTTTDHISPAGCIAPGSPAAKYLESHGVERSEWNSYGSRRGNHEVMMRGTFANIRIKNQMLPGVEGGVTKHIPSGEVLPIWEAAERYQQDGHAADHPRRQGVWHRLQSRLGRQGTAVAGRARRHRRELRAHPPQQPGGHGHPAAAVRGRRVRQSHWG